MKARLKDEGQGRAQRKDGSTSAFLGFRRVCLNRLLQPLTGCLDPGTDRWCTGAFWKQGVMHTYVYVCLCVASKCELDSSSPEQLWGLFAIASHPAPIAGDQGSPNSSLQVKEKRGSRITNPQLQIHIGTGEESEILDSCSPKGNFPHI